MNHPLIRAALFATVLGLPLAACGGSGSAGDKAAPEKPAAFSQADYTKAFLTYLNAEDTNFKDFSTDTPLTGTKECSPDGAGAPGAQMLCKVGEYDSAAAAKSAYVVERNRAIKALPKDAKGGEQVKVSPAIPVRFAALSGGKAVVVVVSQESADKWLVGYVFRKP